MNPHYHPYTDLSSPPPHSMGGGGNYMGGNHQTNGHNNMGMLSNHHQHFISNTTSGSHPSPGMHPLHQHSSDNVNNNNSSSQNIKICAGCGGKIMERYLLHALERYWHNNCLKCACCGAMLAEIGSSCFFKSNMILCKQDYLKLFGQAAACSACGVNISASEYVMRAGGPSGGPPGTPHHPHTINVFHVKCFTCNKCGIQLMPGDRYYLLNGNLVCEQDWHKILKGNLTSGPGSQNTTTGTTTVRKGKVGRPRRSRD
ncbi:hypothetical protein M8J75_002848 [Diaphorina citri]|nr:hypothetical protein M8J75_002848 [Diaphorina citri]KAI5742984.1 hypothetical protein M8J77_013296 [Diaphorina citri]